MRRTRRWLLVLLILVGLFGALVWGARQYLASQRGARLLAERLQDALGGLVELEEADVGFGSSTLHRLQLFEPDDSASAQPWAAAEKIEVDVSLWDVVRSNILPTRVTVTGGALTLRFDDKGKLLTKLPGGEGRNPARLPVVRLDEARLTVRQQGRDEWTISGLNADVRPTDNGVELEGKLADPTWGDWTVSATWDQASGRATATLKTDTPVQVTQAMLDGLPFVSRRVWEEVQAAGTTTAVVTITFDPTAQTVRYKVVLHPENTKVHVTAIDLHADQANGEVVIEDEIVHLRNVTGRTAGGTLETSADLNFRDTPEQFEFKVAATGLDVRQLPKGWLLPPKLEGRLQGRAHLRVTLRDGDVQTSGEGQGEVVGARVAGLPAKLFLLKLRPEGRRFRFAAPAPQSALPSVALWTVALTAPDLAQAPAEEMSLAEWVAATIHDGVWRVARAVKETGHALAARLRPLVGPPDPNPPPTYLEVSLGMQDVDVEQLVRALEVPVPFPLAGKLTFQVDAAIPVDRPRDLKLYRFTGTAQFSRLVLAGLELEQVRARAVYRDGVLRLEELHARVPDRAPALVGPPQTGTLTGTATLPIDPQGELSARLTLENIPLARVLSLLPELDGKAAGVFSAAFTIRVPSDKLPELDAWEASGTVSTEWLRLYGATVAGVTANLRLRQGSVAVTDARGQLDTAPFSGSARLPLRPELAGNVELRLQGLDVSALARALPALPITLEGRADATLQGTITPAKAGQERDLLFKVALQAQRLRVQGIPTERLHGTVNYRRGVVEYRAEGEALGGRFQLQGRLPPADAKPAEQPAGGRLRIDKAQLGKLWEVLGVQALLGHLQGVVDVDLAFEHEGDDRAPVGNGRFVVSRLRWHNADWADTLRGEVRLTRQELRFRDLTAAVGEGSLRGQVALNLKQLDRSWFTLDLNRVEIGKLLAPWPAWASRLQGALEVRLRGTLGREWRGTGQVALTRGKVFGVEVSEWRLPLDWALAPARGRGQVEIRESSAQVARGRVVGQASVGWGVGSRVEGKLRFFSVDLRTLLRESTELSQLGSGQVTGRLDFSGTDVRTLDDLTATLETTLAQTQAFEFPVLRQMVPFLLPGQAGTTFRNGELRGRLAKGIFRIQRLSLLGTAVQVFLDGTVTLQGRLSLEVFAHTARLGVNPAALRLLGLKLPVAGPVPVALLLEASRYFSDRMIHLRVTGTLRQPTVRVEPLSLLKDEAVRFFLQWANVPVP